MKTINNIFFLLACTVQLSYAQSFSAKTNDIRLNFKNPSYATLRSSVPTITWVSPSYEHSTSQESAVNIEATVTSDVEIKSIKIILSDGTATRGEKPVDSEKSKEFKIKQHLKLMDGQNFIKIVVENVSGGSVSSTRSVMIGKDAIADAVSINRKDYALFFATDQYDHWTDLVNPVDDARSLSKLLKEQYGFEVDVIENPNQEEVFIKLAEYSQRSFKPQDQLMIFFAGHGYFDDTFGEGFVVAKNSLENDRAKTTYISHNRLRGVINNIPNQHIFLAMDVCFGGTFDPVIASARGLEASETSDSEFLVRKLSKQTRKYLTSGGKEYVSDGIPGKHSPFTLKLLQALNDSGGSDRILTLSELKTYVEKLKPEPRLGSFGDDKVDSDFVFIRK
ncbi:MAG TPA: caspase family protein [Cyclobacteriaceae bacterium]